MKKIDIQWIFVLFGTAVGAGILFLPLQAGQSGFLPLLIATILAFPMILFSEKNVAKLVMSYKNKKVGLPEVFTNELGFKGAFISTIIYLLSCYTVVLAYAISLPVALSELLSCFAGTSKLLTNSIWFSFFIFLSLIAIVELGKNTVLKVMSYVIYPLTISLLVVSIMLIPKWNLSFITSSSFSAIDIIKGLVMVIPMLVFAMNYSQSISEMCLYYKQNENLHEEAEKKVYKNIKVGTIFVMFFTIFFTFSTILSLDSTQIKYAITHNEPVLNQVANVYDSKIFAYIAYIIALMGIVSSFIGVYLGTRESLKSLILQIIHKDDLEAQAQSSVLTDMFVVMFIFVTLWLASIFNPSIIKILGQLTAPCIALMIFFLPLFIIYKSNKMVSHRHKLSSILLAISGTIVVLGYFVGSFL